jgi:hypothetical protein
MEEIVRQVGYLPELYEDARSEKYLKFENCNFYSASYLVEIFLFPPRPCVQSTLGYFSV